MKSCYACEFNHVMMEDSIIYTVDEHKLMKR